MANTIKVPGSLDARYSINTKRLYRAKLDIVGEVASPVSDLFANITLLDPNILVDYPGRDSSLIFTRTYEPNSYQQGILKIANIFSIFSVHGAAGLRVRLYASENARTADLARPFSVPPSAEVLFDAELTDTENPVFPYSLLQTEDSTLYFTVNNTTGSQITSNVILYYFKYQPSELIPRGYLPRHYKFNRYEGIAQRRRNYVGCKLTYCPEGCTQDVLKQRKFLGRTKPIVANSVETESPVIIYPSTRTSVVVNTKRARPIDVTGLELERRDPIDEILGTGGRGKLDDI